MDEANIVKLSIRQMFKSTLTSLFISSCIMPGVLAAQNDKFHFVNIVIPNSGDRYPRLHDYTGSFETREECHNHLLKTRDKMRKLHSHRVQHSDGRVWAVLTAETTEDPLNRFTDYYTCVEVLN